MVVAPGQRRDLHGIGGDEGRLDEFVLDGFFEQFHLQLADPEPGLDLDAELADQRLEGVGIRQLPGVDVGMVAEDGFGEGHPRERGGEIQRLSLIMQRGGTGHGAAQFAQHLLGEGHQFAVIGVGLIELEHGELGVVLGADAFVAEIAVDLEDPLKTAHHQPLQIQLRGDAQK